MAGVIFPSVNLPGFRGREGMYDHFHGIYVVIPDYIQLYSGEIYGNGSVWNLGGDGCGLGISGVVFYHSVFQGRMEKAGVGVMWLVWLV